MIVKSTRPGILLIADAGLKLRKGETAEISNATIQVEAAFKRGFLVEVTAKSESEHKQEETSLTQTKSNNRKENDNLPSV